jgi:hypothetical protein
MRLRGVLSYLVAAKGLGLSGFMTTVGVVLGFASRGFWLVGWRTGMNLMRDNSFATRDTREASRDCPLPVVDGFRHAV